MKGVVLSLAPQVSVVDLTHDIPAQDVRAGAWALREAASCFPRGTVHVAVVDPGVGTERRPLLVRAAGQLLLGPDNGLLSLAVGEQEHEVWHLDRAACFLPRVSRTFHGRDVFAAVAGRLAAGARPEEVGTSIESWHRLHLPRPRLLDEKSRIQGRVIHVDRFGNLITNIEEGLLGQDAGGWLVACGELQVGPIRKTFGDVEPGQWVAYVGSGGALEIAVREGQAARLAAFDPIDPPVVTLWQTGSR